MSLCKIKVYVEDRLWIYIAFSGLSCLSPHYISLMMTKNVWSTLSPIFPENNHRYAWALKHQFTKTRKCRSDMDVPSTALIETAVCQWLLSKEPEKWYAMYHPVVIDACPGSCMYLKQWGS